LPSADTAPVIVSGAPLADDSDFIRVAKGCSLLVNISDGFYTDNTDFSAIVPALNPPLGSSDLVALYAVKHNPFAYFQSVQEGNDPDNSLRNVVSFEGGNGLLADLASGNVPALAFIAPNQCNDQHGRGNAGAFCNYDPSDDGSQSGLNPALIYRGDVTVQRLVQAIHVSPAWRAGSSAMVVVWDENDYSLAPNTDQVLVIGMTEVQGADGSAVSLKGALGELRSPV
jgi:phosphatidylinositol-3-phosphatase